MKRILAMLAKAGRLVMSSVTLAWRRAQLGSEVLARGVSIAPSARVVATDDGRLRLGQGIIVERFCSLAVKYGSLTIGEGTFVGMATFIVAREQIRIGRNCLIAEYVTIRDQDHVYGGPGPAATSGFVTAPIVIGDNVWLGAKVTVLKGVTIGNNVVVGANSVVTRDLPDNVVAVGAPARVIGHIQRPEP